MKATLEKQIAEACEELFGVKVDIELTRPEEQFGDYATNAALQLAGQLQKPPREIAETLSAKLNEILGEQVKSVSVAGPGFINIGLTDKTLMAALETRPVQSLKGQAIVAEYSDPNPFKVLHAGHLYTSVVGDAVANLLEQAGASVHRVNFGGDVGLHVAKTMWAILRELDGDNIDKLNEIPENDRSEWLAKAYISGTNAYDKSSQPGNDPQAKLDIVLLNKIVYDYWSPDNDTSRTYNFPSIVKGDQQLEAANIQKIYGACRQWSYDYFDNFYARIGTRFEKYYPESETAPVGLQTVRRHLGEVYEESEGAVIFDGEKHGLHTRVFINSEGLPTYETKDVGLIMKKWQDYRFDQSIVITGNDIIEYMKVVLKSIEQFMPELPARSKHLTHGIVKLAGGTKMSSRKGNILRADDVLIAAADANQELTGQSNGQVELGAVKYAFLKNRIGGDIIYDPAESVSLEGNSGPYLQYAHARARSILRKAEKEADRLSEFKTDSAGLESEERSLVRKITEYPEVVDKAVAELMPHHVCTYLYELAQVFNRFYERNRVIGDRRQDLRLALVERYTETLKAGLELLGIAAPEQM